MTTISDFRCVAVGTVITLLVPMAASAADPEAIEVGLSYSDAAIEQLDLSSEQVIVSAFYSAAPVPGSEAALDEIGMIDLGSDEVQVPVFQLKVIFPLDGLLRLDPAEIDGLISANINVYSARLSSDENILNCDFFDGPLESLRREGTELHCYLISENQVTRSKS